MTDKSTENLESKKMHPWIKRPDKSRPQLERENIRDPLTGAYNRSFLEKQMDGLIANKIEFTTIMLDIDLFKNINDTHGHPAGDSVLKEFTRVIDEYTRKTNGDIVARYGGEEFMVLIPHLIDKELATERAEEIRSKIETTRFRIPKGELTVTSSIGVGIWNKELTKEDFMRGVDSALYEAKKNGRNGVVMAK